MSLTTVDQGLLGTYAQYTGFKNKLINGQMQIDQRNAGVISTPTANPTYVLDRWRVSVSQSSKISVQQNAGSVANGGSVVAPAGFTSWFGITSLAATSTSSDYYYLGQSIEGFNIADLGWGTANAKTVTLSFQVYSSLTGTFGGSLYNNGGARSYPFTYSIPVANTWTTISVTIAGDTSGTWLTTNGLGVSVNFGLGVSSTFSGTAGSWSGNTYFSATGATSVVGTNGATFYLTGVQFEKGSTATSFDYRPYGTELQLCQRYYEATTNNSTMIFSGDVTSGQDYYVYGNWVVPKRASPAFTPTIGAQSGFSSSTTSPTVSISSWSVASTSTATGARKYYFFGYTASAEL